MGNITPAKIEKLIYIIRDQQVMLDSDLAKLYGVETGALNRQIKRNQERFPEDFMFQLAKSELKDFQDSDFNTAVISKYCFLNFINQIV